MNFCRTLRLLLAGIFFSGVAWGAETFTVEDIRVEGLQRISAGTVFNYLPIGVGDKFTPQSSADAIRALFETGFFKDVRLERDGSTLVVVVEERPAIASVVINGNKEISTDDLRKELKKIGLTDGKVFNRQVLDKVDQELRRAYFSRGKYGVKIDLNVTNLTRNRVGIEIAISEGKVARIKQINIVGNKVFSDEDLLDEFELSTTNILSFYTKDDQYSKQKLGADLERLRSFYLDRGYINFSIDSTQVSITPDKKEIYITINVTEGAVYRLNKVKLAGDLIVAPDELIKLVRVGPGEIFSRKQATETQKAISDRLGDEGYTFANVNMVPDINEEAKTVDMTFFVDPGKRVYVRRINMQGNTKTRDEVLRREMRQMESSWAATSKIERSKTRLERLGYFQEVNVETQAVPGTSDQIDVNYTVEEKASGNLMAGIGFSQVQGLIFNANVSQDNVFGTGKRINFAFNNSDVSTIYRIGYFNPYYTLNGISRGFDISYRSTDATQANTARYSTDMFQTGLNFGIPLNEFDSLRFNADYKNTTLNTTDTSSREIQDFIDAQGDKFNTFSVALGWSHDTLNRAIFATEGGQQRLSALVTVPGSDLEYFKISYKQRHNFPIAKDLTLSLDGEIAYGDGYGGTNDVPFFEHYFAGGANSVRGFKDNTLGPRDSRNDPFGGSSKLVATAELFFPVPFVKESKSLRMGTFFDLGNVYDSSIDIGELRYSVGISGKWLSPFGALAVSLGVPLNADSDDEVQNFQFSFGSGF
ncbi:MAG: outer membrane protein assembly factor BamA [Pseudomonadota bacterium]